MDLKSRIGELLQVRSPRSTEGVHDSESLAREKQERDDAQRQHMGRLRMARNRELNELRTIMRLRQKRRSKVDVAHTVPRGTSSGVTRPPAVVDGPQMVSLINDLEVKVLSEPMGLTLPPQKATLSPVTTTPEMAWASSGNRGQTNLLDDTALMIAAHRWDQAGMLLLNAVCSGKVTKGIDWLTRSAIDLLERGEREEDAARLRQRYRQSRGRMPGRVIPSRIGATHGAGRLLGSETLSWKCPARLEIEDVGALEAMLNAAPARHPRVMDWSLLEGIDAAAIGPMHDMIGKAMQAQAVFVHLDLSRLIRTARQELPVQLFSRESWSFWLSLLNWNGFRSAHRTAAAAFARRFQCDAPSYISPRCVSQPLKHPPDFHAPDDRVQAVRLLGDLTREHSEELERLGMRTASPGKLLLLDCRHLTSVDFFFGTDLLNWVTRRHSQGETVSIVYAHPLLAHFLNMLGLRDYAKLHGVPPPLGV